MLTLGFSPCLGLAQAPPSLPEGGFGYELLQLFALARGAGAQPVQGGFAASPGALRQVTLYGQFEQLTRALTIVY